MYRLKLGTSVGMFRDDEGEKRFLAILDELKALEFDAVDLDMTSLWTREEILERHESAFPRALQAIKDRGLYLNGIHLPFGHYRDYSWLDEEKRVQLVEDTVELFRIVDQYSPYCYLLHGSKEPIYADGRAARMEALKKSLAVLVKSTKTPICVENLPRSCLLNTADETIGLVDTVEGLKICCDTNHFLLEKTEDAILKMGARIATLHVSDHDYINERHVMPGYGKIDWMLVLDALERTGYQGVFNYEVTMRQEPWVFFTYADMKANHDMLFRAYELWKTKRQKNIAAVGQV